MKFAAAYPWSLTSVLTAQLLALGVNRLQRKSAFFVDETIRRAELHTWSCVGSALLDENCRDRMLLGEDEDVYNLLNVPPDCSPRCIRDAYRSIARQQHPDKRPSRFSEEAARRQALLNRAYEILKDPDLRRAYDEERARRNGHADEQEDRHRHSGGGGFGGFSLLGRCLCRVCSGVCAGLTSATASVASAAALVGKLWRFAERHGFGGVFARSRARNALALATQ